MGYLKVIPALVLCFFAGNVEARLVEGDLFSAGDGLVTRDTQSGLEWLDLSYTFGRSYNDVANDTTITSLGFRHALVGEVSGLFVAGNVVTPTLASAATFINLLSETWGVGFPFPTVSSYSGGLHETDPPSVDTIAYSAVFIEPTQATSSINNPSVPPFNTKVFSPNRSGNFLVRNASPDTLLADLVTTVIDLNLASGVGNALDSKLQNALYALDRAQSGDSPAAIGLLYSFIHSVEAQRGKQLTEAQADDLIASVESILRILEGG